MPDKSRLRHLDDLAGHAARILYCPHRRRLICGPQEHSGWRFSKTTPMARMICAGSNGLAARAGTSNEWARQAVAQRARKHGQTR
eukprot:scaffold77573_cov27-Tisochrysis_lutea.AAC.2